MSVDSIFHWGTAYTMSDYTSKAHNIYLAGSFAPSERLYLHGTVAYNLSEASLGDVDMPDSAALAAIMPSGFYTGHNYDYTEMPTYSDLDYEYLSLGLGLEYRFAPNMTFSADGNYADLTDNAGYVYGVESGSLFLIRMGVRIDF